MAALPEIGRLWVDTPIKTLELPARHRRHREERVWPRYRVTHFLCGTTTDSQRSLGWGWASFNALICMPLLTTKSFYRATLAPTRHCTTQSQNISISRQTWKTWSTGNTSSMLTATIISRLANLGP